MCVCENVCLCVRICASVFCFSAIQYLCIERVCASEHAIMYASCVVCARVFLLPIVLCWLLAGHEAVYPCSAAPTVPPQLSLTVSQGAPYSGQK